MGYARADVASCADDYYVGLGSHCRVLGELVCWLIGQYVLVVEFADVLGELMYNMLRLGASMARYLCLSISTVFSYRHESI